MPTVLRRGWPEDYRIRSKLRKGISIEDDKGGKAFICSLLVGRLDGWLADGLDSAPRGGGEGGEGRGNPNHPCLVFQDDIPIDRVSGNARRHGERQARTARG